MVAEGFHSRTLLGVRGREIDERLKQLGEERVAPKPVRLEVLVELALLAVLPQARRHPQTRRQDAVLRPRDPRRSFTRTGGPPRRSLSCP